MELLTRRAGSRPLGPRGVAAALAALLVLSVGGCFVLRSLGLMDDPLEFSHARHLEEGLSCADCHAAYEEDDAERPLAAAQCALCHEELDQGQPPGRRVAALFVDGRFQGARVTAMSDEVLFSHSTHVSSGLACTVCHQGIEESEAVDDTLAVEMATCVGCHERAGMPKEEECSVCHKELSPDRAPFNHAQAWKRRHGQTVRAEMGGAANDCRLCHSDQACTACHLDEKPASHNLYWHGRGHGIEAAMDRESCATCHQSDSCDRCHEEAEPLSHTGAWAGTLQTHCVSCHIPVQDESCFVCHQGTPSHELAPPLPSVPPHSPASDCRACHGVTTPLPHVDNGDNCVFCHN